MLKQALLVAALTVFLSSLANEANAQPAEGRWTPVASFRSRLCCRSRYSLTLNAAPRLGLFSRCRYTTYAQPSPSTLTMTPEKVEFAPSCSGGTCVVDPIPDGEYIPTDEGNVPVKCALCVRQATNGSEEGALCAEAQIVPGDVAGRKTLLDIVNATRRRYGRAPLVFDETLERGAIAQADVCRRLGYLRHAGGVAEILAQNTSDFNGAVAQWLSSPAHFAILTSSRYTRCGIGVVHDSRGRVWHAAQFR